MPPPQPQLAKECSDAEICIKTPISGARGWLIRRSTADLQPIALTIDRKFQLRINFIIIVFVVVDTVSPGDPPHSQVGWMASGNSRQAAFNGVAGQATVTPCIHARDNDPCKSTASSYYMVNVLYLVTNFTLFTLPPSCGRYRNFGAWWSTTTSHPILNGNGY